jgi:2-aminoethylphosphonate-pyruvate transaminase
MTAHKIQNTRNDLEGKLLFTPGPPPVINSALAEVSGTFGRGDEDYSNKRNQVIEWLREITGHDNVVELQGSGSLAIEIMIRNFLFGKVLVVQTGYYSERILEMCNQLESAKGCSIREVKEVSSDDIDTVNEKFDWIIAAYVETSVAFKQDISKLRDLADRCSSSLALDAVASIGLEDKHNLADVLAFSSCKGLFGITGASFVAYNSLVHNQVGSFYLDIASHKQRLMTGPYAQIQYLFEVSKIHAKLKSSVEINKRVCLNTFKEYLVNEIDQEPLLCTRLSRPVKSSNPRVVLYSPRSSKAAAVLNHLGEIHLGELSRGRILDYIEVQNDST